ncbi:dihydroxyacetone kinase family protein [Antrihabitans cavernicola]|uniref:Dihydroxyacetone kinase family protein n=1 Tax=Antrihabitans cavernicola TaxID=2495913 RepID=A0A5A7SG47_9NOCA|nr:dihydroxyacetone kinase family protein [Spelaeibacter cavernicola]KAA0023465.1 dihydroxyacetone kinase family protein [Spelaeibacter cavernicola]
MANFIDNADTFLADSTRGFVAAHPDARWDRAGFLARRAPLPPGRVAVVSGGGSGHEPLHAGFLGDGMLTAVCPGLVFTSPNALQIAAATTEVDAGAGVLHIVKNYTGDVMNFRIGRAIAAEAGVTSDVVLVDDDVATESESGPGRRGTAATIVVEKLCGAAAARGDTLSEVAELGRRTAAVARSMSVALSPCTVPGATAPSFDLEPGQMEVGIGIHGERGVTRTELEPAESIVRLVLDRIVPSASVASGDRVFVVVNGLGATHDLELHLLFGHVVEQLAQRGISVLRSLVGTFVTALDMAGASITVVKADEAMLDLWDAPTAAPSWPRVTGGPVDAVADTSFAEPDDTAETGSENRWLTAFVGKVLDQVDNLTALDRQAGDGDFGTNMAAALKHFSLPLRGDDPTVLTAISTSYLLRSGGTSGAVFGTFFRALAQGLPAEGATVPDVAAAVRTGLRQVQDLGGAQVGDKTVVDALSPAADALDEHTGDLAAAFAAAAAAASDGVAATRSSVATRGRASYVGDAARGVEDPGALVMSWLFEAWAS